MPDFNYVDPMDGLIKGQKFVTGLFDQAAQLQAGKAYQGGDLKGAAGLLASRGDIDAAAKVNSEATTRTALTAANAGDYTTARAAAAEGGDPALYGQARGAEDQERAQRLEWMGHATDALLQVPAERRPQAFQQLVPTLHAMGVPEDQVAQLGAPDHLSDESLNAFKTTIGQMSAMDVQTLPDGTVLGVDKKTGASKVIYQGKPKPVVVGPDLVDPATGEAIYRSDRTKYMTVTNDDGTTSVVAVGGEGQGAGQAGAMAGGGGAAPASPKGAVFGQIQEAAAKAGAKPEEVSYLNRLAQIESGGRVTAKNGSSTGLFQFHPDTFASVLPGGDIHNTQDQTKAALALQRRDKQTLAAAGVPVTDANVYVMHQQGAAGGRALLTAPPEVSAVAALEGAGVSHARAVQSIVGNGGRADMTAGQFVGMWRQRWGAASAPAAPAPAPAGPASNVVASGTHSGTLRWEQLPDGRQRDTRTGKIEGTAGASAANGTPPVPNLDQRLVGDAVLHAVPAPIAAQVKALADGRMQFPSGAALKSPYWQQMLQMVAQFDPSFDAVNYNARAKTRADFTSGKSAQNLKAINTAIGHLGELSLQADKLPNNQFQFINRMNRGLITSTGGTPYSTFEGTKTIAAEELRKVFAGSGGGSLEELRSWERQLDSAQSPQQLKATITNITHLLGSRLDAVGQSYTAGMGKTVDPVSLLTPAAQRTLMRLQGRSPSEAPSERGKAARTTKADPLGIR